MHNGSVFLQSPCGPVTAIEHDHDKLICMTRPTLRGGFTYTWYDAYEAAYVSREVLQVTEVYILDAASEVMSYGMEDLLS